MLLLPGNVRTDTWIMRSAGFQFTQVVLVAVVVTLTAWLEVESVPAE